MGKIKEELASKETVDLAIRLGFDGLFSKSLCESINKCTQPDLQKFLRDSYGINVYSYQRSGIFLYSVERFDGTKTSLVKKCVVSEIYEEAIEEGLQEAIKWILKNED